MRTVQEIFNVVMHYEFLSPSQPYMGFALFDAYYEGITTKEECNAGLEELDGRNADNDDFPYDTRVVWFSNWDQYKDTQ